MSDFALEELAGRIDGVASMVGIMAVRLCQSGDLDAADLIVAMHDRSARIEQNGQMLAASARTLRDLAKTLQRAKLSVT